MAFAACIPYDWNDLLFNVLHTGGGIFGNLLNLLLLLPLTVSFVLATGAHAACDCPRRAHAADG